MAKKKRYFQLEKAKTELLETQKRETTLNHDIRSMAKLLKDTQANLRLLNEKVGHLSVIFRTENSTAMHNLKGSFIDVTISYGSLPSDYPTEIRPSEKEQRALET